MPEVNVKVRPVDPNAPGFLPRYRQLLASKRALSDPNRAQPEDIDEAMRLLMEHVTEPVDVRQRQAELEKLTANQLMDIFGVILGEKTVPPANGGA